LAGNENYAVLNASKTAAENLVLVDDAIQDLQDTKLDKSVVIKNGVLDFQYNHADGSYSKIWAETDGGGSQYKNAPQKILSYVGTNDEGPNGICVQIYSKYTEAIKDSNNNVIHEAQSGTRLNVNPGAMYYLKGTSKTNVPGREIAVKDDVDALEARIAALEAIINNQS
jgi:hypothetical protein